MSGTERRRMRPRSEPRPICPRCGRGYSHLETRRVGGREYLYAVHESRAGGQRTRSFCYLGPKDGYAAGLVAHSWRGAPWLALSAMGATREEEFRRRLEYLGEVVRAALDAAATEEDLGGILRALDDARHTIEARLAEARAARRNSP
ncbi:MAG: hypothetical protein RXP97_05575 [Nitrososphaeria archaeon]